LTARGGGVNFLIVGRLWAGAIKKEINPPPTLPLAGYLKRPAEARGLHDPLELNLCWLEDGTTPLIFLTLDVLLFENSFAGKIKALLAEELQIPAESILPSATHTHSAPAIHDFHGLNPRDREWEEMLLEITVGAARAARSQARRSSWGFKSQELTLAQNRRRKGGPIDPYFPILFIIDNRENPVVLISGYGCHPVCLDENNLLFSADYIGAFREQIRKYLGLDLPTLFFIGAAGDVNPPERGSFEAAKKLALELAAAAASLLKGISFSHEIRLGGLERKIDLPLSLPFSLEEIKKFILENELKLEQARKKPFFLDPSEKKLAEAHLAWAKDLEASFLSGKVPTTLTVTLTGYRLNDLPILSHPFELLAQLGHKLRQKITPSLWVASCSHGYAGYLADEEEALAGGYEIEEAYRYHSLLPLSPQAEKTFVEAASHIFENL